MSTATPAPQTRYQTEDVTRDQIERSLDLVLDRLTGRTTAQEPTVRDR